MVAHFFSHLLPWLAMGSGTALVWSLVIGGILALRHHYDR